MRSRMDFGDQASWGGKQICSIAIAWSTSLGTINRKIIALLIHPHYSILCLQEHLHLRE